MGEEGFSSDSSLLYHRGVPSAIVDSQVWELPDLAHHAEPPAQAAPPQAARPARQADRRQWTRSPAAGWCSATATCGSATSSAATTSPYYRNASATSASTSSPGRGTVETVFGVLSYRTGDYVMVPRATTHRWVPAEPSRLYAIEANSHIAPPKRYLSRYGQLLEHAPYCERDLHGPTEPFLAGGHRRRGAGQAPRQRAVGPRRHPDDLRDAPVRRGRLGRLPLPLHVQRRGLHADHRQGPPAAAGAPGLRGPQLRGLQLPARARSTTTSCRSRCPTTTPTSTPTRSCSTSAATTRRARAPGIDLGSISLHPGGYAHGPQPSRDRGLDRGGVLRRARGHGRHLPPARPRRGRPGGRGPGVRLDLGLETPRPSAPQEPRPRPGADHGRRRPGGVQQQLSTAGPPFGRSGDLLE